MKKQYHTLILLSGGLDSTTCLFKLLGQTKDEITTLYVDVSNNSAKSWCERLAITRLRDRAEEHIREISHKHIETPATINGSVNGGLGQPPLWMLHAAYALSGADSKLEKRLCVGYTRGDCAIKRLDEITQMWSSIWTMISVAPVPEIYTPLIRSTKNNSQNFLKKLERDHKGLKIINTLWVCEEPDNVVTSKFIGYKPCGRCFPCKRAQKLK